MADQRQGVFNVFGKAVKFFLGDAVSFTLLDYIKGVAKGFGNKAVGHFEKKIEELIKDNPRADLLYVLLSLEPADAEKLWQRHLGAIRSGIAGAENDFIRILGQAIPRDKDGKVDEARAKAVFLQIAQLDEAKFFQVMEELNHDPIAQHIKHWLQHGRSFAEALLEGLAYGAGLAARAANGINQGAAQTAQEINDWQVRSEFRGTNRIFHRGKPRRSLWTWFASKHHGLL